jgi:DNA (cytosine-5)-methyltransferase 1
VKYGSVCSGIEAATAAWHPLGWGASFFSEIEKFPREVLTHHYPDVPLHGDFTTIEGNDYDPIDLLVGGTPCQSFSVAGLRKGMDDERGNLALEYLRLAQRLHPRWLVWENVPGVLSSNGGRDFGSFLGGLVQLGYGFAYRVLDAQYFGLAQRRRRVFVVGCLGDWRPAAAVLFEREGLRRDTAPSREAGEEVAGTLANRTTGGGFPGTDEACSGYVQPCGDIVGTLTSGGGKAVPGNTVQDAQAGMLLPILPSGQVNVELSDNLSPALNCNRDGAPIAFKPAHYTRGKDGAPSGIVPPLTADADKGDQEAVVHSGMQVRRLTPVECERLQGFPDEYTAIPWRGKGNSMAVPCMRWIGERIDDVQSIIGVES